MNNCALHEFTWECYQGLKKRSMSREEVWRSFRGKDLPIMRFNRENQLSTTLMEFYHYLHLGDLDRMKEIYARESDTIDEYSHHDYEDGIWYSGSYCSQSLEIIGWLIENKIFKAERIIDLEIEQNNLEKIKYIYENFKVVVLQPYMSYRLKSALLLGNIEIAKYLLEKKERGNYIDIASEIVSTYNFRYKNTSIEQKVTALKWMEEVGLLTHNDVLWSIKNNDDIKKFFSK